MKIIDYFYIEGNLARYNYVMVEDNGENIAELHALGCSDEEIVSMRNPDDNLLDVLTVLIRKGYHFSPKRGFYKPE